MSTDENSVLVGLSGGVDSAVAALLLKQSGCHVIGAFMKNWDEDDGTEYCTAVQDFEDAQRIADCLDVELRTISFAAEYWEQVFEEFLVGYREGITPNPDVLCNREIKFGLFLDFAERLGIQQIAMGHYARGESANDGFGLYRARDLDKDQTYFLHAVPRHRLAQCRFPLANMTKTEVRMIAREHGLHVHDKPDSTGICFIGERRFSDFIARYVDKPPGDIHNVKGTIIGRHEGLAKYTIGQRQGLKIGGRSDAREAPWYVMEKHLDENVLVVTQSECELFSSDLVASQLNLLTDDTDWFQDCQAMIRYRQTPQSCRVHESNNEFEVVFEAPQRAVAPGQYVVFYDSNRCVGGARIAQAGQTS